MTKKQWNPAGTAIVVQYDRYIFPDDEEEPTCDLYAEPFESVRGRAVLLDGQAEVGQLTFKLCLGDRWKGEYEGIEDPDVTEDSNEWDVIGYAMSDGEDDWSWFIGKRVTIVGVPTIAREYEADAPARALVQWVADLHAGDVVAIADDAAHEELLVASGFEDTGRFSVFAR